jgi:hypothetical protein
MAVIQCARCGTALTVELRRVAALQPIPKRYDDDRDVTYEPVERGGFVVDDEARTIQQWTRDSGSVETIETDPAGAVVTHPDDRLPGALSNVADRSAGCCGLDGCDGPNQACAVCGAVVGTARTDCWTEHEVRFWPTDVVVEHA